MSVAVQMSTCMRATFPGMSVCVRAWMFTNLLNHPVAPTLVRAFNTAAAGPHTAPHARTHAHTHAHTHSGGDSDAHFPRTDWAPGDERGGV